MRILEIIGYTDDKETFAGEFVEVCIQQSFLEMIDRLPKEKVSQLEEKVKQAKDIKTFLRVLHTYLPPELLARCIERNTAQLFEEYLKEIVPTLDEKKAIELKKFLETIGRIPLLAS